MNYDRIYREFIADRKHREGGLSGYTEKHHIVPRHLGGTDDPTNLVRLTAEDHFFAHLVLAMRDKTMSAWAAVMIMHERDGRVSVFSRAARQRYAWTRRAYGKLCNKAMTGEANPNYRGELITLKRADGTTESLPRLEWFNRHNIAHAALCGLLSGKNNSHYGWMLPETDPACTGRSYAGRRKRSRFTFDWLHTDGRTETMSPFDLAAKYGFRAGDASAVARGEHKMCFGWSIAGTDIGWPCGRQHFRDERVHVLVHQTGRSISGTQVELRHSANLTQQDVSALVTGDRKSAGGWMTEAVAASGYTPRKWTRRADSTQEVRLQAA